MNDDSAEGGLNSRLVFTTPDAGDYVIRVTPVNAGAHGAYRLTLADAPPPPWIACPDIPYGSIGWRMGGGEGVMIEFSNFWRGVSSAGRATYRERHPAPKGWERFYSR